MTAAQLIAITFGAVICAVGVVLLFFVHDPKSQRFAALFELPQTFRRMARVVLPLSDEVRVVDAFEMGYTLSVPCSTGWFWHEGKPVNGTLFCAVVPLGYIAKLPGVDFYSKQKFTDASSICLVPDSATQNADASGKGEDRERVELLQRSRRWQVIFRGGSGDQEVRTLHSIPIRGHAAIHTNIELDVTDPDIDSVFTEFKNYSNAVEAHVIQILREFAAERDYAGLVTSTPEILQELNKRWTATATGSSFQHFSTQFTGIIINLLVEQEEARLRKVLTERISDAESELDELRRGFEQWTNTLTSCVNDPHENLRQALDLFSGKTRNDESGTTFYEGGFPETIRIRMNTDATSMRNQRGSDELLGAAKELIPRIERDLQDQSKNIVRHAAALQAAIRRLLDEEAAALADGKR